MFLVSHALQLGARPRLRISLHETEDVEGDLERARPLFQLLASRPGRETVIVTVHNLAGGKTPLLFRCQVDSQLLREISQLLKSKNGAGNSSRRPHEGGDRDDNSCHGGPRPPDHTPQGHRL
jgi:hypothetical protein